MLVTSSEYESVGKGIIVVDGRRINMRKVFWTNDPSKVASGWRAWNYRYIQRHGQ